MLSLKRRSFMVYDTIIVGGGVAGLTAGMNLGRARHSCLVLEGRILGGQTALLNTVSNYPGMPNAVGYDISKNLIEQVKQFGTEIVNEMVVQAEQCGEHFQITTTKNQYLCRNLIIATGAKTGVLGLPEEKKFVGRGVSYCATCDGNLFKQTDVAVVGVGNTAKQDINYLLGLAKRVFWLVPNKSFNSQMLKEIANPRLQIMFGSQVLNLNGKDRLESVTCFDAKTKKSFNLSVDGLFVELGRQPDLEWLKVEIKKDKKGFVLVDKNCQTSHKGIFACGDIISRELKQIITACSDGAIASNYICKRQLH